MRERFRRLSAMAFAAVLVGAGGVAGSGPQAPAFAAEPQQQEATYSVT